MVKDLGIGKVITGKEDEGTVRAWDPSPLFPSIFSFSVTPDFSLLQDEKGQNCMEPPRQIPAVLLSNLASSSRKRNPTFRVWLSSLLLATFSSPNLTETQGASPTHARSTGVRDGLCSQGRPLLWAGRCGGWGGTMLSSPSCWIL